MTAAPPAAALPAISLATAVPKAAVVAVLTRPADEGVELIGTPPVDLADLLMRGKAKGAAAEVVSAPQPAGVLESVLAVGIGDGQPADLRKAGAAIARHAKTTASVAVDLRAASLDAEGVRAFAEGLLLASYGFTQKKDAEPRALKKITLVVGNARTVKPGLDRAVTVTTATAGARDLVNTPSLTKTPQWLAEQAAVLLKGITVRVRDEKALVREGFGGIVGVGQGSTRPPRLIEASYDGGGKTHVVLVGKGITFDTGGLSLKPNDGMLAMKTDMGGGAAVLGTLRAVADLKLPIKLTALVCAAENMPSGTATRPGDVLRQYGGTTVEVLNTDAEGRLVLADGIAYAAKDLKADIIIDVATLTGAMPVALGKRTAGIFASSDSLADELLAAAAASGEQAWRMPLVEDYRASLDSPIADLRNIGRPKLKLGGGSITAALFLREFAAGVPWAHLDIAGPARADADEHELTKGGTGYGVRLLTRWLETISATRRAA